MVRSPRTLKGSFKGTRRALRERQRSRQKKWMERFGHGCTPVLDHDVARHAWVSLLLAGEDTSEQREAIVASCPAAFRQIDWGDPNETDEE